MKNPFKKKPVVPQGKPANSRMFVNSMISKPTSQKAEALYELMANYKEGVTRKYLMNQCGIWNAPESIRQLRKAGVEIITHINKGQNKYGRPVKWGTYFLIDFKQAASLYEEINKTNT